VIRIVLRTVIKYTPFLWILYIAGLICLLGRLCNALLEKNVNGIRAGARSFEVDKFSNVLSIISQKIDW
jgi:hypothetical protein